MVGSTFKSLALVTLMLLLTLRLWLTPRLTLLL